MSRGEWLVFDTEQKQVNKKSEEDTVNATIFLIASYLLHFIKIQTKRYFEQQCFFIGQYTSLDLSYFVSLTSSCLLISR